MRPRARTVLFLLVFLAGCAGPPGDDPPTDEAATDDEPAPARGPSVLSGIRTWAYQIQQVHRAGAVDALAASKYDLLVLEPTRTDWSEDDARDFDTKTMVDRLRATTGGLGNPKLLIAYIDIGQAEDWRWYWTWSAGWPAGDPRPADWPDFVLTHDPDGWEGNFPVAYWDARWRDIVIFGEDHPPDAERPYRSVLDEVLQDGFDGVYLDWVEGFDDPAVQERADADGTDAAEEMVRFIEEIRTYARARDPDFLIIQQNAAQLSEDHPELYGLIDAIAQEAVWFDGSAFDDWDDPAGGDEPNDAELTEYYLEHLDRHLRAGLPVFNVEYAIEHADEAYALSSDAGYVPYCSRRPLSNLTTTPPPGGA